jgi:UDP-2,4-diacetamido-2,4,6-trideoxy-beta-L-altropyranose hydrolase
MRVIFRNDASLDIGIGHVMRCLTLADALRAHGANCHFICREHPGHLLDQIRKRGFTATALPSCEPGDRRQGETDALQPAHAHWLGCDWQTDAQQTGEILAPLKPDWLVVDHYALDSRWEHALRAHYGKLLVIDDLADRPHACDLLLDQNLGREAIDYANLVPEHCTVLAGPRFALLRPEFAALREYSLRRRESPAMKHLLITMGGVDRPNATGQVLEALKTCPLPADCEITVVMGGQAPWLDQVREIASTMPWPTEVRVDISDIAQVMSDSNLSIGAAGTTSWERCSLGLPALMVVLAENQWAGARALLTAGAALLVGEVGAIREQLVPTLAPLLSDEPLVNMSRCASDITDGEGSTRVVERMECPE